MLLNIKGKYKLKVVAICTKEVGHDHKGDITSAIVPLCQHLHVQFQNLHSRKSEIKGGVPRD
jgi:hypothetical protein